MKINSCKSCVNPYHKPGASGSGSSGGGNDESDQNSGAGGSGIPGNNENESHGVENSLMNYLSENMQVRYRSHRGFQAKLPIL